MDNRYQFQPWYIKVYRWVRWYPWHYLIATYVIGKWLIITGGKIPQEETNEFLTRTAYIKHLWRLLISLAHMKMQYYYTMEEVLGYCLEDQCQNSK